MANERENAVKDIVKALKKVLPFKKLCDKNGIKLSDAASSIVDFAKNNPEISEEEVKDLCDMIDNLNKDNVQKIAEKIVELRLK